MEPKDDIVRKSVHFTVATCHRTSDNALVYLFYFTGVQVCALMRAEVGCVPLD